MKFEQPPRREDADDKLIPLINIVFLMLIFFMIAGQIRPTDPIAIEPPETRGGETPNQDSLLLLLDAQGQVALDGEIIEKALLAERLVARLSQIDPVAQRATSGDDQIAGSERSEQTHNQMSTMPSIQIKADAAVDVAQLRALMQLLEPLGVKRVHILTEPTRD